ncbi:MAG: CRISPR-associated endonuclease Cas2 [Saprospiraceae bacterium]|nr:MAG: CRISPR-associated endonuclease Cas2 [Saprospiraceae bacterium]
MYYCVYYDISHHKTRLLAVKLCKQAGLVRVQRSVFLGEAAYFRIQEIEQQLKPLLKPRTDSLLIQPLDRLSFDRLEMLGKKMDKTVIARKQRAVFF